MDVFDDDLLEFWSSLNEAGVLYIMIGGVATNLHGFQRMTDDIDVWIKNTPENRSCFRKAMKKYSQVDYFMLETLQIIPGWTHFNLNNCFRLDVMVDVKGLEGFGFDECLAKASIAEINNIKVPFLHINHLMESKKAANRPKDQIDLIYLEKIKNLLKNDPKGKG